MIATVGFSLDDVLQLAEQMEHNGARFYRIAADATADPQRKHVLLGLSEMEQFHEQSFAKARSELTPTIEADTDEVLADYVRAWVDGEVFDRKPEAAIELAETGSLTEVIRKAIAMEKETISFYAGVRDLMTDDAGRQMVNGIMREELTHVVALGKLLSRAAK